MLVHVIGNDYNKQTINKPKNTLILTKLKWKCTRHLKWTFIMKHDNCSFTFSPEIIIFYKIAFIHFLSNFTGFNFARAKCPRY